MLFEEVSRTAQSDLATVQRFNPRDRYNCFPQVKQAERTRLMGTCYIDIDDLTRRFVLTASKRSANGGVLLIPDNKISRHLVSMDVDNHNTYGSRDVTSDTVGTIITTAREDPVKCIGFMPDEQVNTPPGDL